MDFLFNFVEQSEGGDFTPKDNRPFVGTKSKHLYVTCIIIHVVYKPAESIQVMSQFKSTFLFVLYFGIISKIWSGV